MSMNTFDFQKGQVYFRDRFVPFGDATLSIASSPILYGLSVYTVFSVNWNEQEQKLYAFRLEDHYKRLVNSANVMDFNSFAKEWTSEKFRKTMVDLVRKNNIQEDALVRTTVYIDEIAAGTKIHDLKNGLSAYVYPMGEILPTSGTHL